MSSMSPAGGELHAQPATTALSRERLGAISGIVFVILVLVATFVAPTPPKASDSVEKITAYFVDHRGAILFSGYLSGLSLIPVVIFIATLYTTLREAEGAPGSLALSAYGSALITGVFAVAASLLTSTLAFTGRDGDAATMRALFNLYQMATTFIWFPLIVWMLTTALVMLRMPGAYRWVAWLGLLGVIVGLLTGASTARNGFFALGGILGLIAFLIFAVWILATSIIMLVQARAK